MYSFTKHEYAEIPGKPARIRMWIDRTRSQFQTCIWLKLLVTVLKVCMVAERASQHHAPAHLQNFICAQPRLRASIGAMLPSMGSKAFTPGYVQNLDEREREKTMMILGMVAAARAMWQYGGPVAERMLRQMGGNANVDYEVVLAQVDWAQTQQQSPESIAVSSQGERQSLRRYLGFEELQLSPGSTIVPQPQQQQQQQVAQQQTIAPVDNGHVARMAQQFDTLALAMTDAQRQTEEQQFNDDIAKQTLQSIAQGKRPIAPDPLQDPDKDTWLQTKKAHEQTSNEITDKQLLDHIQK